MRIDVSPVSRMIVALRMSTRWRSWAALSSDADTEATLLRSLGRAFLDGVQLSHAGHVLDFAVESHQVVHRAA